MPRTKKAVDFDLSTYLDQRRKLDAQKKEAIAALLRQKDEIDQALQELQGDMSRKRKGRPPGIKSVKTMKATKGRRGRPPGSKNKPKEEEGGS